MRDLLGKNRFYRRLRFAILMFSVFSVILWSTYMMNPRVLETLSYSPEAVQLNSSEPPISEPLLQRPPSPISGKNPYSPVCAPDECTKGHWVPRPIPFSTLRQVHDEFAGSSFGACKVYYDHTTTTPSDEELQQARENRTINISNWIWQPDNGQLLPWDADEFVARLYQSPGGLIIIGDSMSIQHFQTIMNMLQHSGLRLNEIDRNMTSTPTDVIQLGLMKSRPENQRAIRLANVPQSRIDAPFLTIIQDHTLLQSDEIRILSTQQPGDMFIHTAPQSESEPNWQDFIKSLVEDRMEDGVTKDSVVLLNTGAHWSLEELSPFVKDYSHMDHVMSKMINEIITSLSPLANTTIYFRSTSPGHPSCARKTVPYSTITEARNNEVDVDDRNEGIAVGRSKWSWGSFARYNEFWKKAIEEHNTQKDGPRKGINDGEAGAIWKYMDVWGMSIQRADAHTLSISNAGKSPDCLHFCIPFVLREWTLLLAHAVLDL